MFKHDVNLRLALRDCNRCQGDAELYLLKAVPSPRCSRVTIEELLILLVPTDSINTIIGLNI